MSTQIIKPETQSALLKVFGRNKQYYLSVSVLCMFELSEKPELLQETDLWTHVQAILGKGEVLDAGMPKARGEVLLKARAFVPDGKEQTVIEVGAEIGSIRKSLFVFGDRYWDENLPGIVDPLPFSEMDIRWEKAFGGDEFPANPEGKGLAKITREDGQKIRPLPNIEYPDQLVRSPKQRPQPAGFDQVNSYTPARLKGAGTFDENWLQNNWPYFPDDFDWGFFNAAPADQQIPGYFAGDETIILKNLNKSISELHSRLPNIRTRCFVKKAR